VIKLLIVDDSALMRRLLGNVFAGQSDFAVTFARNGVEALVRMHDFQPTVVTLDVEMPEMDGLACLHRIMIERPCPVIMVSALTEAGADATLEAISLGAVDFVAKPSGAISLEIDEFGPLLVEKVRAASTARLSATLHLTERVRLRLKSSRRETRAPPPRAVGTAVRHAIGEPLERVVLVGCSTGGPPALDALLAPLPEDFPWPILVAQHMPASFTGPLARRLDRQCALKVLEVTRPMTLTPGHVYIGRGDADIVVASRAGATVAAAAPTLAEHRWHPSVDRLVTTAMQHIGASRLIGVLMTGMGDDGAAAMTRLRAEGGSTIAEAEATAVVWGMPGELVKAGGADVVAPLGEIATQLLEWVA
jgi:two-component system, chemotaxis family, protein-glutamate methylesterase/glutaminase